MRGRLTSPGFVIAVLALVAALAGTAVAEQATTAAKPVTKKKVKKIVAKLAPDLSVASAETAARANTAATADNAGQLDNLESTAFERRDAVVAGFGNPLVASQEIVRAQPLGLRVLTDAQTDNDAALVAQNIGPSQLTLRTGAAPGDVISLAPNATTLLTSGDTTWNATDAEGNPIPQPFRIELLAFGNGRSGVLSCFMPQGNPPDYCELTQGQP